MTAQHSLHVPTPAADACSIVFDNERISAYGTAARADFLVALEQPGPWGRAAAVESHLDPTLGAALDAAIAARAGRLLLVRTPGAHADPASAAIHHTGGAAPVAVRRVRVARTGPTAWMVTATISDPSVLLTMPDPRIADASSVADHLGGTISIDPELLVCTNGRRDVCCAVRGRPVALAAAERRPGQVWEVTHTGGHRYAPTGILLPWGRVLARLDADLVVDTLAAAATGQLPAVLLGPTHDRGGMHLSPPAQAAESAARHRHGWIGLDDVTVTESAQSADGDQPARWTVVHRNGARQEAIVTITDGPHLAESCGKTPVATRAVTPSLVDRDGPG